MKNELYCIASDNYDEPNFITVKNIIIKFLSNCYLLLMMDKVLEKYDKELEKDFDLQIFRKDFHDIFEIPIKFYFPIRIRNTYQEAFIKYLRVIC